MSVVTTNVNVVCPVCLQQHLFLLLPGYGKLNCPKKSKAFDVLYAKTRAKNQHSGARNSGVKVYQIRYSYLIGLRNWFSFKAKRHILNYSRR